MTSLRSQEARDLLGAEEARRQADERGEPAAVTSRGAMLEEQGDVVGAAAAYRRASDSGDSAGAIKLGRLLARHHDVVGAEAAYRRASALGDHGALDLLAELAHPGAEHATEPTADAPRTEPATNAPSTEPPKAPPAPLNEFAPSRSDVSTGSRCCRPS